MFLSNLTAPTLKLKKFKGILKVTVCFKIRFTVSNLYKILPTAKKQEESFSVVVRQTYD